MGQQLLESLIELPSQPIIGRGNSKRPSADGIIMRDGGNFLMPFGIFQRNTRQKADKALIPIVDGKLQEPIPAHIIQ
jgi:hypothetical protein